MTTPSISLLKVHEDKVLGDASVEVRTQFAREAEELQARAHQIGLTIGMSSLTCCSATYGEDSIAFRFAQSSQESFDAGAVFVRGMDYATQSLYEATI